MKWKLAILVAVISTGVFSVSAVEADLFVSAPGDSILSTMIGNKISKMTGTSMACPHVSGLAALILSRNPKLSAEKVREIIGKNTNKLGREEEYTINKKYGTWNEYYGYGLIDAYKAVVNTPLF